MLSSVPELHGYIDKSQLTEDLGGTLDYCHTRWLCHRTVSLSGTLPWMWATGCDSQQSPVKPLESLLHFDAAFSKDMFM